MSFLQILDFVGTFAFAVSGALKAARKGMDLFGLAVLAVVTAIGGGTLRDMMLGRLPFWFRDSTYILLSLAAALGVFVLYQLFVKGEMLLLIFDAIGLGAFTIIGGSRALEAGLGGVATVVLATLTGIGGGVIRDVLARDVPVVLCREIYASACIVGATLLWLLHRLEVPAAISEPAALSLVILLRLLSLHFHWGLPRTSSEKAEGAACDYGQ